MGRTKVAVVFVFVAIGPIRVGRMFIAVITGFVVVVAIVSITIFIMTLLVIIFLFTVRVLVRVFLVVIIVVITVVTVAVAAMFIRSILGGSLSLIAIIVAFVPKRSQSNSRN